MGGNESDLFCCSLFSKLQSPHVSHTGDVYCNINWSQSDSTKPSFCMIHILTPVCLLNYLSTRSVLSLHPPLWRLPACVCGCRVSSCHPGRTVADVITVRCWFLQSEGIFLPRGGTLTATSDVTSRPPSHVPLTFVSPVATPQLWGSPGTGGKLPLRTNYFSACHLTYISPWWVTIANWGGKSS